MEITPAGPGDLPALHALLTACGLPLDGLDAHLGTAVVARDGGRLLGSAALEVYPPYALLRSVAVDEASRGRGLGLRLTDEAIGLARRLRLDALYLLTETAGGFFPKRGFAPVARADVPADVQRSVEFTSVCPVSALVMRLELGPDGVS
jgi:amino-acid N-acetyltransferase